MVYVFNLRGSQYRTVPNYIIKIMDTLIDVPYLYVSGNTSKQFSRYVTDLRNKGLLHMSTDRHLNESILSLKINNFVKPNSVQKIDGKHYKYIFKDLLIPKFKI